MHPRISNFQALLTTLCAWSHLSDLIEMRTLFCHMVASFLLYLLRAQTLRIAFEFHERLSLLRRHSACRRRFFTGQTSISIGRTPGLINAVERPKSPVLVNTTWEDIEHRDKDEEDET
jgi:hypothetical protein